MKYVRQPFAAEVHVMWRNPGGVNQLQVMVEVSLYPMCDGEVLERIVRFVDIIEKKGIDVDRGCMSAIVTGETAHVFDAIREAYERVAAECRTALMMKVVNSKPEQGKRLP